MFQDILFEITKLFFNHQYLTVQKPKNVSFKGFQSFVMFCNTLYCVLQNIYNII